MAAMHLRLLKGEGMAAICSVEGCIRPVNTNGWCQRHYYALREMPKCSIDGCDQASCGKRTWCSKHYQRWKNHGDPEFIPPSRTRPDCSIPECSKPARSRGLCQNHYMRLLRTGTTDVLPRIKNPDEKRCPRCELVKQISQFSPAPSAAQGVAAYCKSCANQRVKDQRSADKIAYQRRDRGYKLRSKHGMTLDQYDAILAYQGSGCATCHRPPTGTGGYHLDHDHETGEVRGMLCHHCNLALGHAQDDPKILAALIGYLQDPPARHILEGTPMSPPDERSA